MEETILLEINENGGKFEYTSTILQAELEISTVSERIDSIKSLKPTVILQIMPWLQVLAHCVAL